MIYRSENDYHGILSGFKRKRSAVAANLPYSLSQRNKIRIYSLACNRICSYPDIDSSRIGRVESTETQSVKILDLRSIVVQYHIRVTPVVALLRILRTASAINFLENNLS